MSEYPQLLHTVIDTTRPRQAAEFYRELMGWVYGPDSEPPTDGSPDDADWLVLRDTNGVNQLAFQEVATLQATTWPEPDVPMQLHLDLIVSSAAELERQRERAEALGARVLLDRTEDPDEPLYVFADLDGHPFCIFVG